MAIMRRMENLFRDTMNARQTQKEVGEKLEVTIDLQSQLQAATTSPAIVKSLTEILRRNLAGEATPKVKQYMGIASRYRKALKRSQQRLAAGRFKGTPIQQLQQRTNLQLQIHRQKYQAIAATKRAQQAALSPRGTSSVRAALTRQSILVALSRTAGIVVGAARLMKATITAASNTMHSFADMPGGVQANVREQIADLHRNIRMSFALRDYMNEYAEAITGLKDSTEGFVTNVQGALLKGGSLIAGSLHRGVNAVSKWFGMPVVGPPPPKPPPAPNAGGGWLDMIRSALGIGDPVALAMAQLDPDEQKRQKQLANIGKGWVGKPPHKNALKDFAGDYQARLADDLKNLQAQFDPNGKLKGFQPFNANPNQMMAMNPNMGGPGAANAQGVFPQAPAMGQGPNMGQPIPGPPLVGGPGVLPAIPKDAAARAAQQQWAQEQMQVAGQNAQEADQRARDLRAQINQKFGVPGPRGAVVPQNVPPAMMGELRKAQGEADVWRRKWDQFDQRNRDLENQKLIPDGGAHAFFVLPGSATPRLWA